jgi:hypothetical protein
MRFSNVRKPPPEMDGVFCCEKKGIIEKAIHVMKIFETPGSGDKKRNHQPLYPERPSEGIEDRIRMLGDFEAGRREKIPLTPEERTEIQSLEETLGVTLEKIFDITPKEATFFAEYFLNEEGKREFETLVGTPLGNAEETVQAVEKALYEAAPLLGKLDAKKRGSLTGHARDYSEQLLLRQLSSTRDAAGHIATVDIAPPKPVQLLLTPAENLAQITALQAFKNQLKQYTEMLAVSATGKSAEFQQTLLGILKLYQSRVNAMLAEGKLDVFALQRKADALGRDALTEDERVLLVQVTGIQNAEMNLSRYDKFLFGATTEYDASGQRNQVGAALKNFADQFEEEYVASVVLRNEQIKTKGLDPEKIAAATVPVETVEQLAEETLRAYGLLSEQPASEYTPDRSGPASDNKWQFVTSDAYKTLAIDDKRKAIKCGRGNQSVANLLSVTLAHEIEGHVLQHENKSKIPLRLFNRMGSGRSVVFAECGAMNNQDAVSREAFGYASPPHPYYVRAMQKKLEGGNYFDCLTAFYESTLKSVRLQKELGRISEEEFEKQCEKNLKLAINRTKRLFRRSSDLAAPGSTLVNSKDTVYLEQVKLFQELKKHHLEKYAFVLGANLDALLFLMQSGFLDPKTIEEPRYHALKIWDRVHDDYTLPSEE